MLKNYGSEELCLSNTIRIIELLASRRVDKYAAYAELATNPDEYIKKYGQKASIKNKIKKQIIFYKTLIPLAKLYLYSNDPDRQKNLVEEIFLNFSGQEVLPVHEWNVYNIAEHDHESINNQLKCYGIKKPSWEWFHKSVELKYVNNEKEYLALVNIILSQYELTLLWMEESDCQYYCMLVPLSTVTELVELSKNCLCFGEISEFTGSGKYFKKMKEKLVTLETCPPPQLLTFV